MATDLGYDQEVWSRVAGELGWPAVPVAEDYGGLGLGLGEIALLMEEMGAAVFCSPFLATVCLAGSAIALGGSEDQKAEYLPAIAAGELTATVALTADGRIDAAGIAVEYKADGDLYVLNGAARFVIDGASAALLIVAARRPGSSGEAGIGLFLVQGDAEGLSRQALPTLDQTRRQADIDLKNVRATALGEVGDAWPVLSGAIDRAITALAAEQAGGARKVLQLTVDYIQERVQFGRAIGSFQAIKHRCADMMVKVESALAAANNAAAAADAGDPDFPMLASLAKAYCSDAFFFCAGESIQLHGGVGFTWEYDPHLFFKRARASAAMLGDANYHRERIAQGLGALGPKISESADSPEDHAFRQEARAWLSEQLEGPFAHVRFRGGPGEEDEVFEERIEWEQAMGKAGWTGISWPKELGGRAAPLSQQVIFYQEYARAGGPGRVGHIGEGLVAPTIIAFGTEEQKRRFLPGIKNGTELWCQGYSEPNAGSDLANVQTRARLDGDAWVIDGQKVWTSLAHKSGWCFVIAKTDPDAPRYRNLSFLLVPMDQPGITVKPIVQLTGTSEFNEVFFDGARAEAGNVVGGAGNGWKVAMGLLGFERGASTLGQQIGFENEFREILAAAKANGATKDPVMRQKLAQAWIELQIVRLNALTNLAEGTTRPGLAAINKLTWATWHRDAGELAMAVLGPEAEICAAPPYALTRFQSRFLFSRSDTIYGGTNEIQRNIIAEQALGLPREPRPDSGKN